MCTLSAAKLADAATPAVTDVKLRDVDVTHGGGDVHSTDGLSLHQKPTGSRNGRDETARSTSTADFSQQTTQNGSTQTTVALRLRHDDNDDDGGTQTTARFLGSLDDVVMTVAEHPCCNVTDTAGLYLLFNTLNTRETS